jgi:uncharacterized protein
VKALREYIINFGKLKLGKHEFEFTIDDDFYSHFEYSLVKKGKVNLLLTIDKQRESLMIFTFDFNGSIQLECDRCLDEFNYPVHSRKQLFVKLGEEEQKDNDDEMIFLGTDDYEIDISPYIYEFINLELPLHKTCDEVGKQCNPGMLDYLGHLNEKEADEIDPRWAALKKISGEDEK